MSLKHQSLLRQQCLINGQWYDSKNGEDENVTDPATGEVIARVAQITTAQTIVYAEQAQLMLEHFVVSLFYRPDKSLAGKIMTSLI